MNTPAILRRTVLYRGRVQGVGFRATTVDAARGLAVTGYVRNLADGRVELVAEGKADALDELERRVQAALEANIQGADRTESPATGEYQTFAVRR
ncbi:MAG: Acylphosphatase [Phycisphaerae bacterium]|nr:Acylphosphatase [Phycisphaerae bacterium]